MQQGVLNLIMNIFLIQNVYLDKILLILEESKSHNVIILWVYKNLFQLRFVIALRRIGNVIKIFKKMNLVNVFKKKKENFKCHKCVIVHKWCLKVIER